jgi:hypothetical protein
MSLLRPHWRCFPQSQALQFSAMLHRLAKNPRGTVPYIVAGLGGSPGFIQMFYTSCGLYGAGLHHIASTPPSTQGQSG